MTRLLALALVAVATPLAGCATLSGSARQAIEIRAVDAHERPVQAVTCQVANDAGVQSVTLPAQAVEVRRSASELEIECRLGAQIARGTAVARGDAKMEHSFIPGGSIAALVDHLSGYMYSYPTPLTLRLGEHLRFEFSDAPRAELIASLRSSGASVPAPAGPLPVVVTPVTAAQVPTQPVVPDIAGAPARPAPRRSANARPVAAAPAARPAVRYESLDPRDLRLRAAQR